ncbi:hypothetical protein JCM10908_001193 [Rhodotorula pacifica]|uniref:calcium/hydrogen antiporter n=1 Tax=Rhodotorula pacifica TaxID=1495444 RepID=UPI00316E021B
MSEPGSHPAARQPSTASVSSSDTARNEPIAHPAAPATTSSASDDLSRTPTERQSYAEIASSGLAPPPPATDPSPQTSGKLRARTSSSMSTSTNPSNLSSPSKRDAIAEQSDEDEPHGDERFFTPRERVRPPSTQRARPPPSTLQLNQSRRSISINTTASKTRQPPPPSRTRTQRSASRAGITSAASSAGQGGGGSSGEESEDEEGRTRHRRGRQGATDDDDDEVETKDRGEMLVRKRMKERKEARKAAAMAQKMREESQRRVSVYAQPGCEAGEGEFGYGFPSSSSGGRTRDPSAARSEVSHGQSMRSPGLSGPSHLFPTSPLPHAHHPAYPHVPRPPIGDRGASFVSTASGPSRGGSDTEGPNHAESLVERDDRDEIEGDEPRMEDWRDGGGDGPLSPTESEDEDGEVEYTLKDRQDAINVEHPFGLPIWKPALYKKSRSIARRAESAVHAAPSSVALHHLLPSNIIWTLVFGTPLFLLCGLIAAILLITPFGGAKYGRVVWELGTYLVWPFGKYVEGWVEDVGCDEEDEDENGHAEIEEPFRPPRPHGSEQATLRRSDRTLRATASDTAVPQVGETANLLGTVTARDYGATKDQSRRSSEETIQAPFHRSVAPHDFSKDAAPHSWRVRALGRVMYWICFYGIIAPALFLVAAACWAFVFTIPMAKLLWVLLRHLNNEPLSIYFRSPPDYQPVAQDLAADVEAPDVHADDPTHNPAASVIYPLRVGQPAPPRPPKSVAADRRKGRLRGPHPTVLLCTYRAAGLEYYKYTVDGVNVWFVNLTSLIAIAILDFFILVPYVEKHDVSPFLRLLASQAFVFVIALLSVIPLSYFIGMAVASISAQSSIGMGAVINASFGSIIEIVLYSIALTQAKGELVEGSIVGSLIAGVLLMPGVSMIGGAVRRKEQRFNARSAGVTSTMLIMAVVGVLTPTLFYEIYGSFQLTCTGCTLPTRRHPDETCRTCYYEHVSPADDPFYRSTVLQLSYYCAVLLVLSYLIGLWFSLKTHASQIWQNAPPAHEQALRATAHTMRGNAQANLADRRSFYQRLVPTQLLKRRPSALGNSPGGTPPMTPAIGLPPHQLGEPREPIPPMHLPHGLSQDEFQRAIAVVASATLPQHLGPPPLSRAHTHTRDVSSAPQHGGHGHPHGAEKEEAGDGGHGGHDAPNWSRAKSATVLLACTILYAVIAEILVDVVDVVLQGSGISEKLLGVILFALVPNTTEFMNAISFALNGNIALSMEIGSAYALQVCLIQIPAMLAFTAWYSIGKESMLHRAFTLVFPRWDAISILFSVFLLSYIYIESRSNYQRGSLLILSYLVLLGGFVFAPNGRDTSDNPEFGPGGMLATSIPAADCTLRASSWLKALALSLFSR